MNPTLLERLRGFQIPAAATFKQGHHVVARLCGIDFEGIINSQDFGFDRPFDANFSKMMIRTASHLLGGDACGKFSFVEQFEFSVLLDPQQLAALWRDVNDLQTYLVGLADSKMSLQIQDEALFTCHLYSFAKADLVISYFMWRQQEAYFTALDRYCIHVLSKDDGNVEGVRSILDGLGIHEKEEILHQNNIEYEKLPAWQRLGTAIRLAPETNRLLVDTNLPKDSAFRPYLLQNLE